LALTSTEDGRFRDASDPGPIAEKFGKKTDAELVDFFLRLFLQGDVAQESRSKLLSYLQTPNRPVPVYWDAKRTADYRVQALCHVVLTWPEFKLAEKRMSFHPRGRARNDKPALGEPRMIPTRRDFLRTSLATGSLVSLGVTVPTFLGRTALAAPTADKAGA